MKVPDMLPPAGMCKASERIAEIKARFRSGRGAFAGQLARAEQGSPGEVKRLLAAAARRHGVDAGVLLALAEVESGLRPEAISPKGAAGVMQLMPGTAQRLGLDDLFDVSANIDGGARYLRGLLDQFGGDTALALAAYNAGPGAVRRYGGVPPYAETRRFVERVLARMGRDGS